MTEIYSQLYYIHTSILGSYHVLWPGIQRVDTLPGRLVFREHFITHYVLIINQFYLPERGCHNWSGLKNVSQDNATKVPHHLICWNNEHIPDINNEFMTNVANTKLPQQNEATAIKKATTTTRSYINNKNLQQQQKATTTTRSYNNNNKKLQQQQKATATTRSYSNNKKLQQQQEATATTRFYVNNNKLLQLQEAMTTSNSEKVQQQQNTMSTARCYRNNKKLQQQHEAIAALKKTTEQEDEATATTLEDSTLQQQAANKQPTYTSQVAAEETTAI